MKSTSLTMAQALVAYLAAQRIGHHDTPLFGGVFAIFGHGNVTCLGEALYQYRDALPTWRGQNEQSMGLAALAYTKAHSRQRIFVASSSIGPGATNMITAAASAHANRLPVLFLAGDTFANRLPDPVLQQLEHYGNPTITVNDAYRAVTRYWDRITHPQQLLSSLPQAVAMMLDPADCGPAFLALPQDVQAQSFDCPNSFLEPTVHHIARPRPDANQVRVAAAILRCAQKPLLVCGGGVHYSLATAELAAFAEKHNIPVVETIAGRATLLHTHPNNAGPLGVIGSTSANALAADADVVLAVGTRLQDFTTASWSVFGNRENFRLITLNAARFDAHKHYAVAMVGDARAGLNDFSAALQDWRAPDARGKQATDLYAQWNALIDQHSDAPDESNEDRRPTYAQTVGAVNRAAVPGDLALTAAGGFPGELCMNWRAKAVGDFDCEFGFSCMGYEIAGGLGAKMAAIEVSGAESAREVFVLVGDGSYLMMNCDILSSVMFGHKLIIVVYDNGGYAVIDRLQIAKGGASFNNLFADCHGASCVAVDFVAHAKSMGAAGEQVHTVAALQDALARAQKSDKSYVITVRGCAHEWTPNDAWWDVGVPSVSTRAQVNAAKTAHEAARPKQRPGV